MTWLATLRDVLRTSFSRPAPRLARNKLASAARGAVEALEQRTLLTGSLPSFVHASSDAQ